MSEFLPLFPLPNVVLFPSVFLPLHIFEPRYREMVGDVLAADRLIGMALLKPGWESDYEGRPPVYPIGCSGLVTHAERLADGRYNIVLRGIERFRILEEDHSRSYRRAVVDRIAEETPNAEDREAIRNQRVRLEAMLAPALEKPAALGDEDLINALAQYLDLEAVEKQALLEQRGLRGRADSLVELLEMKTLMARAPRAGQLAH